MFRLCAVIPFYNHPQRVEKVIGPLASQGMPIFLVDDGSDVASKAVLRALLEKYSLIRLITFAENQGKGAAVCAGLLAARTEGFTHALQVDADGQHDLGDLPKFVAAAQASPQALVLGAPQFDATAPWARRYGRKLSLPLVWLETRSFSIADALCGYRIYPLELTERVLNSCKIAPRMGFDVEIMVRLCWAGAVIVNVPTAVRYFPDKASHFRYVRDNIGFIALHTRLLALSCVLSRATTGSGPHWVHIGERGTLLGLRLLAHLFRFLGASFWNIVLLPVTAYFFLTAPAARRASADYLARVVSPSLVSRSLVFQHFWEFSRAVVDKVMSWAKGIPLSRFEWFGRDSFRELVRAKKGAVLVSAHLGNMEVLRALSQSIPHLRINALMFTSNSTRFVTMLEEANPDSHLRLHPVEAINPEKLFELQDRIRQGEVVALLADRIVAGSPEKTVSVPFLGAAASFPEGPWVLASLLECPVFLVFALRTAEGGYQVYFEPFAETLTLPRRERGKIMREVIERYVQRLEFYCRRWPLQWFNFYDFWSQGSPQKEARVNSSIEPLSNL